MTSEQWIQVEPETVRVLFSYESIEEDEISLAEGEVRQATGLHYTGMMCNSVRLWQSWVRMWRTRTTGEGRWAGGSVCFLTALLRRRSTELSMTFWPRMRMSWLWRKARWGGDSDLISLEAHMILFRSLPYLTRALKKKVGGKESWTGRLEFFLKIGLNSLKPRKWLIALSFKC